MIHFSSFDVGHNRARAKGGYDNIDNLRPVCRDCNSAMGTITIEEFKKTYFEDLNLLPNRAE
jgi:5-methylcytosine-specific restriction endonuclease McrA